MQHTFLAQTQQKSNERQKSTDAKTPQQQQFLSLDSTLIHWNKNYVGLQI